MNFIPPHQQGQSSDPDPLFPQLDPTRIEMPEDALWQRISSTRVRRRQRRQVLVTAAVGLFGVLLGAGLMSPSAPWQNGAAVVEQAPQSAPSAPANEALRAIDRRLQAAYDRSADPAEIRRLWQLRDAVLNQATATPSDSDEFVAVIEL